jgi:4-amino-4-deoxy-L-arabinose transferase-like glycosyltransferase
MAPVARRRGSLAAAALGLVLLTVLTWVPALVQPRPIDDEANYAVVGIELAHGGRPYVAAIDRKPPLLFWTYASLFKVAGPYNWLALHVLSVAWVLATMAGLFVAGRELADEATGIWAALLYVIFLPWVTWKNLAFNGELLMNLPLVWAWAILLAGRRTSGAGARRRAPALALVGAGALLGAACLLKQPAGVGMFAAAVYLMLPAYRRERSLRARHLLIRFALLGSGIALLLGLVGAVLHREGVLAEAWYWSVRDHDVPVVFWRIAVLHTAGFLLACLPLVAGAAIAARDRELWAERRAERQALLAWLALSAVGVSASGRFHPHYFIQLVPPLTLLAAPVFARIWTGAERRHWPMTRRGTAAWLALTVVVFFVSHVIGLDSQKSPSPAAVYVREHSSPADRILVWGQDTVIYDDAERRPATRYVATFPLTGHVFGQPVTGIDLDRRIVPGSWALFERDLASHPPLFIVDTEVTANSDGPIARFPVLHRMITSAYQPVWRSNRAVVYRRVEAGGRG